MFSIALKFSLPVMHHNYICTQLMIGHTITILKSTQLEQCTHEITKQEENFSRKTHYKS